MERRQFIQLGLLSLAAASSGRSFADFAPSAERQFLSSAEDAAGQHFIVCTNTDGSERFRISVDGRCHAGCLRPDRNEAVIMSRRPGDNLYVINML